MGDWISGQTLPDIPRIYTALAEWLACVLCILEMKHRLSGWRLKGTAVLALAVQAVFLVATDGLSGAPWMVCMAVAIFFMCIFIYVCGEIDIIETGYNCVRAFVMAEFAASLEWQIYCFYCYGAEDTSKWSAVLFLVGIYAGVYGTMWYISSHFIDKTEHIDITGQELIFTVIIGVSVFLISNLGFVYSNTPFSGRYSMDIFNVRTLVDLGGMSILYAYHIQRLHLRAQHEVKSMEMILHNQYIQYQQSQETLELINYKYHDLKHYIAVLRGEESTEKRKEYLDQMEEEIKNYEIQKRTGNKVLDTLLTSKSMYCANNDISFTSVVDGALLDFMEVRDICSIFGNALDNAIECEKKIPDKEKRMIHLSVFSQKMFLIIRFENYCEGEVQFEKKLPISTKKQPGFHGYGLKSLKYTVYKYNGEVDISVEDNWFNLKILIPM